MVTRIFSKGILKIPFLTSFLPEMRLTLTNSKDIQQVVGWGYRPSTKKARDFAARHQLPFIALEDGFLRSVGLGVKGYPPFSMVVDDLGIYYDTTKPSRLEKLILQSSPDLITEKVRLAHRLIVDFQLSKYNHAPDCRMSMDKNAVLVVDQTVGDMAIRYGQADARCFQQMLKAAIQENPQSTIFVKTHPDVLSGKKQGYLTALSQQLAANIVLLAEDINPLSLLRNVKKVYCVTSQMGFEALMLNKSVVTFGVPWFCGWGLTDDRHPIAKSLATSSRRKTCDLLTLFQAAYFQYSRYINPNSGEIGNIFDVIHYLHKQKKLNLQFAGNLYCVGMSFWKRSVLKPFFQLPSCQLHFVSHINKLKHVNWKENNRLLIWGNGKNLLLDFAQKNHISTLQIEDGFIRSVGLGSNLVAPLSIVVDDLGIYFNAQKTSRLEQILATKKFTEEELQQAQELQHLLVAQNIGKYNVGKNELNLTTSHQRKILVVGQVEDDASIITGSPEIQSNLALLKKVRSENPTDYIIYKPHPDVVSGNRIGHIECSDTDQFADLVVTETNILACIMAVDEVHTMTSLAGFEALLRNKIVHCYGLPFYANWGLTIDHVILPRRTRKISLLELIAATLNDYPIYFNPKTKQLSDAKTIIRYLTTKQLENTQKIRQSWAKKQLNKLKHLIKIYFL
ncbi:capsular polysaccharide biosynthesis protein [uncultured Actinobacillus sp.]|uniref:capsular polysaccharide biosynthesis protein n=1 Tax=uncultured Actinobacillus sp. TaxID=417616 RepID=UPI0025F3B51A|nr:capsular polysaccharide biosynthesis protein [uncultured Actinobacillus sp.]